MNKEVKIKKKKTVKLRVSLTTLCHGIFLGKDNTMRWSGLTEKLIFCYRRTKLLQLPACWNLICRQVHHRSLPLPNNTG